MTKPDSPIVFDEERAASYEARFRKLAPLKEALHLGLRAVFADVTPTARVLVVGAGTGAELVALAEAFPGFEFTAVDPAAAMLRVARRRVEERGLSGRCTFHEGTVRTLPEGPPFDAATSILVSHFFVDPGARSSFFREIADRLVPGAKLATADLASGPSPESLDPLFELWAQLLRYSGRSAEEIAEYRGNFGRKVSVLSAPELCAMIAAAGFEPPVQFFQGAMIHAWCTARIDASG